jgi:rhamnosyltransferase
VTARAVAVVVTYRPDTAALATLLEALGPQVEQVVVVDNGTPGDDVRRTLATALPGARLVELGANRGIAAAQNRGIETARALGASHVLLSDQDSVPAPDMVRRLLAALDDAAGSPAGRLVAVGPVTVDERTGAAPLVFTAQRSGPRRAPELPTEDGALVDVPFLIASGTLIDVAVLDEVGPMDESLFIDHVDLEWGMRAQRAGLRLAVVIGARLSHSLGDDTRRVPWRSRHVHVQSVERSYYMVRNTLVLVRGDLLPAAWRRGYLLWLVRYVGFYVLAVPPRLRRLRLMVRGAGDALRGRTGPLTS